MKCPRCGSEASGKFCSHCGVPLSGTQCGSCAAALSAGARFCHACGTPASGAPARGARTVVPWVAAGGTLVTLLVVLAVTQLRPPQPTVAGPGVASVPTSPAPDISQMTPRERADRLFNRVVAAAERGRTDTVQFFKPMALEAYRLLGTLDQDARYHVGLIHLVAGEYEAALAQADSIATVAPQHLFAAILRAEVAAARGDSSALRRARTGFLDAFDAERAANRPEYGDHPGLLDRVRAQFEPNRGG